MAGLLRSSEMRFNYRELALYAASRSGRADKEGCLWMKESEGRIRKKETYTQRWFVLTGNLFFYCKSENHDSPVVGLIILERCEVDPDNEKKNAFKLVFKENDADYSFIANSAKEQDEWTTALNVGSYEYLRMAFSDLRGQLLHLTGKDPLVEDHPLGALPIKSVSPVPASAPSYEGEPVFELSLACSSLVGSLRDSVPSALIVTSCMTPPQAYWIRYAQTEVIEHNCDPRFFTTVVFYAGSVSMATRLKFEIFDVYDRIESKMCPMGQTHCQVMELIRTPEQSQRLEIKFDNATCGYLHIKAWKCDSQEILDSTCSLPSVSMKKKEKEEVAPFPTSTPELPRHGHFRFSVPFDNIVVRTFHFPMTDEGQLKVTEVMGEGKYSFIIPMQLLNLFVDEETEILSQYQELTSLQEDWEIMRQEVMLEHSAMVSHYRESCTGLQARLESGVNYKRSVTKSLQELEFVPVNLHIQQMKVTVEGSSDKDKVVYTDVTVGCPTAYSLKFKLGGLAKMQVTSPLASAGSFSPARENRSFRARAILKRLKDIEVGIDHEVESLRTAAQTVDVSKLQRAIHTLAEKVHQLSGHCNVTLVNDSLRDWRAALQDPEVIFTSPSRMSAGSLCHSVEEHVLCVEAAVDALVHGSSSGQSSDQLQKPLKDFLDSIEVVKSMVRRALFFLLMKESHRMIADKVPIGVKSYKHRRDIVFTQALTTVVTSFVFRIVQSVGSATFMHQIMDVGFLVHWESLLSTHGDEIGMLEDFIVAIHDLNMLQFKLTLAETTNDSPRVSGCRYKALVEVPLQLAIFRVLPSALQTGKEVEVCAVLFTQGVNEQQSLADTFGDSHLQDQINMRSLHRLTSYCTKYKEHFGSASAKMVKKSQKAFQLLDSLRIQVNARKTKNTDILSLSQELCRTLDCGRITSCKSAKDRTGMSVTLEQAQILHRELGMDPSCFQQAIDAMRSRGTRIRNAEKNIGVPLYAFNALQVFALPPLYRPPEGTYKKLQT